VFGSVSLVSRVHADRGDGVHPQACGVKGALEVTIRQFASGWALDPDTPQLSITVHVHGRFFDTGTFTAAIPASTQQTGRLRITGSARSEQYWDGNLIHVVYGIASSGYPLKT
jgi:hypothetical protein